MTKVITLVAEPALPDEAVRTVQDALAKAGAASGPVERLGTKAADIPFAANGFDAGQLETAMEHWDGDWAIQPTTGRRKRVLISDMDSTIITGESLDELAGLAGIGTKVASITARAMNGELDFTEALTERLALLAGQPASLIETVLAGLTPSPGAGALVATMRDHGARCILVSGGLSAVVGPVADRLGFDDWRANAVEVVDGRISGRINGTVVDRQHKLDTLIEEAQATGLDATLAVGDGANDMLMLDAAGLGVAFHAKPAVAAAAKHRVRHCGLDALLYFQGYREAELSPPRWQ